MQYLNVWQKLLRNMKDSFLFFLPERPGDIVDNLSIGKS